LPGRHDAFNDNRPPVNQQASRKVIAEGHKDVIAAVAGLTDVTTKELKGTKVQLSLFYSNYPDTLCYPAAMGHTAIIAYSNVASKEDLLFRSMSDYLKEPEKYDDIGGVPDSLYKDIVKYIARVVSNRMLLMSLQDQLPNIKDYVMARASLVNLRFYNIKDVLEVALIYGDYLPDFREIDIHPLSQKMYGEFLEISQPHLQRLQNGNRNPLFIGRKWVQDLAGVVVREFNHLVYAQGTASGKPSRGYQDVPPLDDSRGPTLLPMAANEPQWLLDKGTHNTTPIPQNNQGKPVTVPDDVKECRDALAKTV